MNIEACFNEPIYNPFSVNEYVETLYKYINLNMVLWSDINNCFPF